MSIALLRLQRASSPKNTDFGAMVRPKFGPGHVGLAATTLIVGLLTAACSQIPMTAEEAAHVLTEQLWREDAQVQAVCSVLAEADVSRTGEMLQAGGVVSDDARVVLIDEAVSSVDSVYSALGVDPDICPADRVVGTALERAGSSSVMLDLPALGTAEEACRAHLHAVMTRLDTEDANSLSDPRMRPLFRALHQSGMTADSLLDQPFWTAQRVDLSSAAVYSSMYFADRLDETTATLVSSFGFVEGLVGVIVQEAAAEMLAVTAEMILDELEGTGLVGRASVARHACQLYAHGGSRPSVGIRLLKRMILRFLPPDPNSYTIAVMCESMSEAEVCEDLFDELELDHMAGADETVGTARYESLVPRLSTRGDVDERSGSERGQLLLEAASLCPEPCSLEQVNDTASALHLIRTASATTVEPSPQMLQDYVAHMDESMLTSVGGVHRELVDLRREVAAAASTTDGLINLVRDGELAAGRLRGDLIATLARLSDCHVELDSVRRARVDFASRVLQVAPAIDCSAPVPFYRSQRFAGVRVPGSVICDPSQSFDFDIATDSLFATCSDEPVAEAASVVISLVDGLAELQPENLMIIGHADERPVETRACQQRFYNNTLLSEARANAVQQLLVNGNQHGAQTGNRLAGVSISSLGFGDIDPRVRCGPDASDDCHRLNRRVTLRLAGARGVEFDLSCVGGR